MKTPNDGGPAFPIATHHVQSIANSKGEKVADVSHNLGTYPGMSLRDWFAGMALQGIWLRHGVSGDFENLAYEAFQQADAMLASRDGRGDA